MSVKQEVQELYRDGTKVKHIAQAYDMSTEGVYQHLRTMEDFEKIKEWHKELRAQEHLEQYENIMPKIIELRKQGMGSVPIASRLGISYHTLKKLLKGTKWDNTQAHKRERNEKMLKMYKEGATQEELAKKFGCSQANISQTLKRHYGDQL